jgi:hypothetical protein
MLAMNKERFVNDAVGNPDSLILLVHEIPSGAGTDKKTYHSNPRNLPFFLFINVNYNISKINEITPNGNNGKVIDIVTRFS